MKKSDVQGLINAGWGVSSHSVNHNFFGIGTSPGTATAKTAFSNTIADVNGAPRRPVPA